MPLTAKMTMLWQRACMFSASELKPNEASPKNKIDEIDAKLKEIAFLEEQKKLSDSLSDLGDLAIIDSAYNAALDYYTRALACNQKEHEQYLTGQVNYVQKQLALKDSAIVRVKRQEYQQIKVNELEDIYHRAMDSISTRNYAAALIYFNQFIDSANNLDFVPEDYDVARFVSFAQKKVIDINESLEREKNKVGTTQKPPDKTTLPSRKIIFYPNPKDPKLDPIYRKYPAIDFNRPPDNQLFDSISDYSVENRLISKEFMAVKSLSLSESGDSGIVLTCQNIFFRGSKMYLKLMIQNLTQTEFLTGRMDLIEKRPDGKDVYILPNYIAGYPIILPYQQKVIVYVTKNKEIPDNGHLYFDVIDRLNKIRVAIDIPGAVYNRERQKMD
jgi:tetratricopeptide (TPR) repeat protein